MIILQGTILNHFFNLNKRNDILYYMNLNIKFRKVQSTLVLKIPEIFAYFSLTINLNWDHLEMNWGKLNTYIHSTIYEIFYGSCGSFHLWTVSKLINNWTKKNCELIQFFCANSEPKRPNSGHLCSETNEMKFKRPLLSLVRRCVRYSSTHF